MKMTARGSIAALMTCMATAVAAAPAVADGGHVPVGVPLEAALEPSVGLPAPKLSTGVPLLTPSGLEAPRHHEGELLPNPILPVIPLVGELAPTDLQSELPGVLGTGNPDEAELTSPASPLVAKGPGAVVGAPLAMPDGSNYGLPKLVTPKLGVVTPVLQGDPAAALGLS
ncbi:hypothetical protein [Streptomyces sp. NPDC097619]|uniref:hypothetical protein n=1 Tax=Streptomyces sp. NPDC097619 TaxID=3157228 RepID=UPI00331AC1D7